MKKFVAGTAGILLMGAGLVASTGTVAHADPYPGTIATTTTVSAPAKVKRKKQARVCADVRVQSGTGTPVGTVTITVRRNSGRYVQSIAFPYSGGQVCMVTRKLRKVGGYNVRAAYASKPGTVFSDSVGVGGFDVVKKRKRR